MEKIFHAQKTKSQIDNPKWTVYFAAAFIAILALISRGNIHSSITAIALIMLGILINKQKNNFYLLINEKGVTFCNGCTISWTINEHNLKNIEYKPVRTYGSKT